MNDTDTYGRLKSQVEYPESWKPEPGETLVGEALRWETVDVDEKSCDVLVLRDSDGKERSIWTWHTVLRSELVDKAGPGDFVAIHYRGKRAKQDGNGTYAGYRVAIEKTAERAEDANIDDFPEGF